MRAHLRNLLVLLPFIVGCDSLLYSYREGSLRPDGRIEPCHTSHTDLQACGNAIFNAPLLSKLQLGMSKDAVRALMQHDAERFDARLENGRTIETWKYMQDYDQERMTAITFTDGHVTAISTVPWSE